jgi:hypothetical protein
MRWATREKEIKANEKNRKKASTHSRRSASKKRQNEIDLGKSKINVKQKGGGYDICYQVL